MAGAPRGSGQSPAELPSPTVECSTPAEWRRGGGGGVRGRRQHRVRLAPIGQSGAGGGTRVRSLAAIGQRRREGGAPREGGGRGVRADVAVAVRGQGGRTGQPLESLDRKSVV